MAQRGSKNSKGGAVADHADTWHLATAQRDRLLNVLEFECIVSGLHRATAQEVSFAAIGSCLRARLLLAQLGNEPRRTPAGRRPDASAPALGGQADKTPPGRPVEPPPPASGDTHSFADGLEDRLRARQRNTVRAQLFAADAHNRAARVHDRAISAGLGDVAAHRQAADSHRAAQADAILRRWTYLTAATRDRISDDAGAEGSTGT